MSGVSNDFERFLYANYPDDYRRATAKDVPEDVLTAILSRHKAHYSIWKDIPEWIKDKYQDRLPREVLNGNEQVKQFVKNEEQQKKKDEKETSALINYSVSLLALGYAAETVKALAENRMRREELLRAAQGGELTEEQKLLWRQTRERDRDAIRRDWAENQPEKYLFHLFKEISRSKRRSEHSQTADDRHEAVSRMRRSEQELEQLMEYFGDREARQRLASYLRQQPQQSALRHFSPEMQAVFINKMRSLGIAVTPADRERPQMRMESHESLAESLRQNYRRSIEMEKAMRANYRRGNLSFSRKDMRAAFQSKENDDINHMMSLRRNIAEQHRT